MPVRIINNTKVLYYNRIDVSEENNISKTSASKPLDPYAYFSQNLVNIEKTLMKLNTYLF